MVEVPEHVRAAVTDAMHECLGNLLAELPGSYSVLVTVCVTDDSGATSGSALGSKKALHCDTTALNLTHGVMATLLTMEHQRNGD